MTAPTLTPHGYVLDGRTLPRVSTILGTVHKDGIWAAKLKLAAETGDPHAADKAWAPSRDLGTAVHALCEGINRGEVWTVTDCAPDLAPFGDAYDGWFQQQVAEVVACEQIVWSATLGYAGRLDMLVRLHDGRLMLGDIKSGKTVDGATRWQLAAYAWALAETAGVQVDGRMVVHLPSDRPGVCRAIEYDDDAGDALTWRALCRVYHAWQRVQHDWKGTR